MKFFSFAHPSSLGNSDCMVGHDKSAMEETGDCVIDLWGIVGDRCVHLKDRNRHSFVNIYPGLTVINLISST